MTETYSSLETEEQSIVVLDKLKHCIKYLQTFNVTDVNEEILQWLLPVTKKCLTKVRIPFKTVQNVSTCF